MSGGLESCARRTQNLFTRYGMPGLIVAKFIPGLSTLAPPMAGSSGISAPRFLIFDGLGSLLQGQLEQSNVSVVNQFVAMILAQRSYESNSRVVKAADEMLQQLNQLAQ